MRTLSDPVQTRSDKHACGKPTLTDHDKQATGSREPANEMNKEDPTQGILVWLQPFTVDLEDLGAHDLTTAEHTVLNEGRESRTITYAVSWYKFSPLSGIRVKPKLHKRRKIIYESLQKPSQKPKVIHTYNL